MLLINHENKEIYPLIVIMSCQKNKYLWNKLKNIISESIIFCGDDNLEDDYYYEDRILYLKCPDTYDYLPTKVYIMIEAILKIKDFEYITHIFKCDDHDTIFDINIIENIKNILPFERADYLGQHIVYPNFIIKNRRWHYYKCPKQSIWYNKPYLGEFVSWADGGCGYILSKKSMKLIKKNLIKEEIHKNHIYEDLMIGIVLNKNDIYPIKIQNIIIGDKTYINLFSFYYSKYYLLIFYFINNIYFKLTFLKYLYVISIIERYFNLIDKKN